ncbi:MAG TPA: Fe-S protein assembly co-chaperone HscB [Casimicrobiaceae bacterium]|nr:Fe-S protein assembly co-chaperone HscB [Casimicrobiaceae bacterium]
MIDFSRNHFELFGVPAQFRIDELALERAYRALQSEVHPDRHASASDADRRMSLQASARVNEGYRTLRDPVLRAEYLLSLQGLDVKDETDTALPFDFLETALERREAVSDAAAAGDERALEIMLHEVRKESGERERELERLLDAEHAWETAHEKVRELKFLTKLAQDIDAAIAQAET